MDIRPAGGLALLAVAAAVGGCGNSAHKPDVKTTSKAAAPRYRPGQYCFSKRQKEYRVGGFTCTGKHHLARESKR
jgi:hypothetical protein